MFNDAIRNATCPLFPRSFSKRKSDACCLHKLSGPAWRDNEWKHVKKTVKMWNYNAGMKK